MSAPAAAMCPVYERSARTAYARDACRCEVCAEQRREDSRRWYRNGASEQQKRWRSENAERRKATRKRQYWDDPEAAREAALEWYRGNRKQALENVRRYREEHPEKAREAVRQWHEENPGYHRKWYRENIERARAVKNAAESRRRARKANAEGDATTEAIQARVEFYGGRCYLCGHDYEAMDHVIPLARGGSNWPANLRPICTTCNSMKGAKALSEVA